MSMKKTSVNPDFDRDIEDVIDDVNVADSAVVPAMERPAEAEAAVKSAGVSDEMKELLVTVPGKADGYVDVSINFKAYRLKIGEVNIVPKVVYDYWVTLQRDRARREKMISAKANAANVKELM